MVRKIGFLADTHIRKDDASDLPDQALNALKGVDLIVHLGDIGKKAVLDRLGELAPVMIQSEDRKGYLRAGSSDAPVKVLEVGSLKIGLQFNLTQPDKKIEVGADGIAFNGPIDQLLMRRFKSAVDVVASAGTHCQREEWHEGVLFFDPGSPTLPSDKRGDGDLGSLAVLDVSGKKPKVKLVRLSR